MSTESEQIHQQLKTLSDNLRDLTSSVESAFPKDEHNNIDYIGHRVYHKNQNDSKEAYFKTRSAIVRGLILWATIGLATVVASTVVEVYILPILKALKTIQ